MGLVVTGLVGIGFWAGFGAGLGAGLVCASNPWVQNTKEIHKIGCFISAKVCAKVLQFSHLSEARFRCFNKVLSFTLEKQSLFCVMNQEKPGVYRMALYVLVLICPSIGLFAQADTAKQRANQLFQKANSLLGSKSTALPLSQSEVTEALRQALEQGTRKSVESLSSVDGFFKNAAVKLIMPEEAKKVEQRLRGLGMGRLVDDAILSMNRAAEDASKLAAPIFIDAIRNMNVQDAMTILRGGNQAATQYLRQTTGPALSKAFQPVVKQSLEKVQATRYWKDVFSAYNKFASNPVNPDLEAYVTEKALDGIFLQIAQEEANIRANPAARLSSITKKVFGANQRP
jgi:hypothetical protein